MMPQTTTGVVRLRRLATVVAVVAGLFVGLAAPAQAAPPSNDHFADATVVAGALPVAVMGTNAESTKEPGEPDHAGNPGGASIWYSWTPDSSGRVVVSTCGSDFDTLLGVYTGDSVDALSLVASDDDACGITLQSLVVFDAAVGTTYWIAIDGFRHPAGTTAATGAVQLRIGAPQPNDDFANAEPLIGALPITVSATNEYATKEPGEPLHGGHVGGASVWYSWTADASGPVTIDLCGSSFDTLLAVYTGGSVTALAPVTANNDRWDGACPSPYPFTIQSRVSFRADAGVTYRVAVDGSFGESGSIALLLRAADAPPNDDFANAIVLAGALPITSEFTNREATKEPGEPDHAGDPGGASIWYSWTAEITGRVVISTCGTTAEDPDAFDSTLAVYTGVAVDALTTVASNDNACGTGMGPSAVTIDVTAGNNYRIAIDGRVYDGVPEGRGRLRIYTTVPNDDFADADVLGGPLPITISGTNADATKEAGEPEHAGQRGGASVWYSWTPSTTAAVTITVGSDDFNALVAVHTGDSLTELTAVAFADSFGARQAAATFRAVAGTTYHVAVDGDTFSLTGTFELVLREANRPPNDDFASAQVLSGSLPLTVPVTNLEATTESGEPLHAGRYGGASVWYTWTPTASGAVVIDVCAGAAGTEPFDSLLAVYTGHSLGALTEVGSGNDTCGMGASVMFDAAAGTTYRIAVDSILYTHGIDAGETELHVRVPAPPANDRFSNPRVLRGTLPVTAFGTNVDAAREVGEPQHAGIPGIPGVASIWYSWTPQASGRVSIDTCPSDFDTVLAVYTGESLSSLSTVGASNDGPECPARSVVSFDAVAGTTYRIAVDGFPDSLALMGGLGTVILTIAGPPPNDDFEDAAELDGPLPITSAGPAFNSYNASREPGEPDHAGAPGNHSLWYSWTPSTSGPVTMDTCGGSVDTLLAVYTGSSVASLTEVVSNDDSCFMMSDATFDAVAGTTYRIAVDGFLGSTGDIVLRIHEPGEPAPPPNDDFADALALPRAWEVLATATNLDATEEQGEPDHAGDPGGSSIWYSWTPPASGPVRIDTCDSFYLLNTLLAVYTGPSLDALTEVASDDRGTNVSPCVFHGTVTLDAVAGTTYWIAVDAVGGNQDKLGLAIRSTDTTAPQTSIESGPTGLTPDTTPAFVFSSDEAASTFECSLDSAAFSTCEPGDRFGPLADGNHTLAVRAIDSTGNADPTPATAGFTIATCTVTGTPGDDRIVGTDGRDVICAGDGDDVVVSGAGDDIVFGEAGDDVIVAGPGDDHLDGGPGTDRGNGGAGSDTAIDCEQSQLIP